jgi:hypothetical protein
LGSDQIDEEKLHPGLQMNSRINKPSLKIKSFSRVSMKSGTKSIVSPEIIEQSNYLQTEA